MSEDQYSEYMRKQVAKDKKLLNYLIETKQVEKAETVTKRIKTILEEISEWYINN